MAKDEKGSKAAPAKAAKKAGTHSKLWKAYEISGNSIKRKLLTCPKCGVDSFLANHKDRKTCGKCGYTEFSTGQKKEGAPKQEKKIEMDAVIDEE
jgi:small subunit ribosomal protein S27Ae